MEKVSRRLIPRSRRSREVIDHDVGAVIAQLGLAGLAIDAHHPAESARAAGFDTGDGVLEDGAMLGPDAELRGGGEEHVGRGLPAQAGLLGHDTIDARFEQRVDAGGLEHRATVLARRDDGAPQPFVAGGFDEPHRARVDLDTVSAEDLEHQRVLASAESLHGLGCRPGRGSIPPGA